MPRFIKPLIVALLLAATIAVAVLSQPQAAAHIYPVSGWTLAFAWAVALLPWLWFITRFRRGAIAHVVIGRRGPLVLAAMTSLLMLILILPLVFVAVATVMWAGS